MNLAFTHTGKRFFFITLALEGRSEALSELVVEQSRPKLTALGEIVKAAFVAVHQVWHAATLSDFVIMPDHIHFILIVNYEISPDFNPLFASHILMTAIEQGWANHPGQGSGAPEPPAVLGAIAPYNHRGQAPEPPTSRPDMAALLRQALEEACAIAAEINRLKRERGLTRDAALVEIARLSPALAARFWRNPRIAPLLAAAGVLGQPPPKVLGVLRFDRRAYIELAFTAPMLRTIRHYIKLNPARKLWKLAHPDRFRCFDNITAQLLKRLPPRYDPSAEDSRELAADRLLILSGFADTPAVPARDIRKYLAASHQFRANCLAMNDLAAELCSIATGA